MKNSHRATIAFAAAAAFGLGSLLTTAAANAAATIVIVNNNAAGVGFNDPTPVAPVGGNTGTTLGQQRLNAFQAAASKWGATLTSVPTISILSSFEPLACTATGAVLGSAGAIQAFLGLPPPAFPNALYGEALTNKIISAQADPATPEIRARFNVNLGQPGCLTGLPFYLGLDNNHGPLIDLVTVLLHEFGHGLNFQDFTNGQTGAFLAGFPSAWDFFLIDNATGLLWVNMTNAQRAASAINGKLAWTGPNVTANVPNVLSLGTPQLVVGGVSAGAAAGTYLVGTASFGPVLTSSGLTGEIMPTNTANPAGDGCTPFSAAETLAVNGHVALINRGICGFAIKVKNAQNAGAIGVIIADNVAGSPPPGLGGTDPTIVIPAVRITLADGNAIRTSLARRSRNHSGVFGTMNVDLARFAGADSFGRALLYAPTPFSGGSSVSHYDVSALPNQLMEPAINGDLTHEVTPPFDLTFPLLQDLGW